MSRVIDRSSPAWGAAQNGCCKSGIYGRPQFNARTCCIVRILLKVGSGPVFRYLPHRQERMMGRMLTPEPLNPKRRCSGVNGFAFRSALFSAGKYPFIFVRLTTSTRNRLDGRVRRMKSHQFDARRSIRAKLRYVPLRVSISSRYVGWRFEWILAEARALAFWPAKRRQPDWHPNSYAADACHAAGPEPRA